MANKGHSEQGLFGTVTHYDEHGKKVGRSEPGLFGGYTNYDANGKKVGTSDPNLFGGYNHYDNRGHKTGSSDPGMFGSYSHTNSNGKKVGSSDPGMFGSYNHSDSSGGCYVATCVYGSYDCPQVWTLRRFRDNILAATIPGRAFIHLYYAVSPTIVKWFGKTAWFKKMWQGVLDKMVRRLNDCGVENLPYNDREW
jgi:hypothetical protein